MTPLEEGVKTIHPPTREEVIPRSTSPTPNITREAKALDGNRFHYFPLLKKGMANEPERTLGTE